MAEVNLYFVGSRGTKTDAKMGELQSGAWGGAITVTSVDDMISKILAALGATDSIRSLNIADHSFAESLFGGVAGQRIGKDKVGAGIPAPYADALSRLKGRMAPGAVINVHGCRLAENTSFLVNLSTLLGAPVTAGLANQYPSTAGFDGPVVTCTGEVCVTQGGDLDAFKSAVRKARVKHIVVSIIEYYSTFPFGQKKKTPFTPPSSY
jgi:hypothetical protein